MPLEEHGSRKAIEHWRGSDSYPLGQHRPTASLDGRAQKGYEMPGRNENTSSGDRRGQLAGLPIIRGNVAGIELGSERHWVCAPTRNRSGREVASLGNDRRTVTHGGVAESTAGQVRWRPRQRNCRSPQRCLIQACGNSAIWERWAPADAARASFPFSPPEPAECLGVSLGLRTCQAQTSPVRPHPLCSSPRALRRIRPSVVPPPSGRAPRRC